MSDVIAPKSPLTRPHSHSKPAVPVNEQTESGSSTAQSTGNVWRWVSLALMLVIAAGLGWAYANGVIGADHRATLPPEEAIPERPEQTFVVTAEPVAIRTVKRTIEAVGTLNGFEEIVVSAKAEGRVLRILRDVADRVRPNELLVEMDPTDLKLGVSQADSNLQVELARLGLEQTVDSSFDLKNVPTVRLAAEKRELARLKMERVQNLDQRQATTKDAVDNAVSEFRMATAELENQMLIAKAGLATIQARRAALAITQQQLVDTQIRAPNPQTSMGSSPVEVSYVVTRRGIAEGTFLRVGDEVCRLVIDNILKLRVPVPERHSNVIQIGQNVDVWISSSTTPYQGTVTKISPSVDTATRTFQVEIQIPNESGHLKPGGFAKAIIEVSRSEDARTVPLSAMVRYAGVIKLFLMENGVAREVKFQPGIQTTDWVEVAEPEIPTDGIVITSGQFHLAEGTKVELRKAGSAPDEETPGDASQGTEPSTPTSP